jgi:DNA modification methylase
MEATVRPLEPIGLYHQTSLGKIILGDALDVVSNMEDRSVDLIMTSPPFGLVRKKEYGNVPADEYVDWFRPFAGQFKRILKESGSFVLDIGGAWNAGLPTRHLYHFKLLIALCEDYGFHLAQDFYWWNPSKLPTPAEWVTVRRIRVKDAINCVWWLSGTSWPKASNRRVLQPYSESMRVLLKNGYVAKRRPSGHDISEKFNIDNGAAIPPNFFAIPNTESNSFYLRYCKEQGLKPNPARYPAELPEYFIRMLTDENDIVLDPFAGSCVTGEYLKGALGRFQQDSPQDKVSPNESTYYKVPRLGILWNKLNEEKLFADGGRFRPIKKT